MKRIPTIIGLVLVVTIVAGLAVVKTMVRQNVSFFSKASSEKTLVLPLSAANVTDTGFSVYWISGSVGPDSVAFGKTRSANDGVAVDQNSSSVHLVRVANLKPGTKYFYRLATGSSTETSEVTTLSAPIEAVADPVFGKAVAEALVVWEAEGSVGGKLVTMTKGDGSYVLPVVGLLPGQTETISVYTQDGNASIVCTSGLDKPLPSIAVGDNLNCKDFQGIPSSPSSGENNSPSGFKVPSSPTGSVGGELKVNLKEKETVSTPLPTISGKAGPNQVVKIEIHSPEVYTGMVKADATGTLSWTPPANLTPGSHTVTITITNPDGTTQTVVRTFYVSANAPILPITAGTPSATPTHRACLNQACAQVEGEGADSCLVDADCVPPPAPPVATPTPVPTVPIPPPVVTPPTGAFENTLFLIVAGLVLITVGVGMIL